MLILKILRFFLSKSPYFTEFYTSFIAMGFRVKNKEETYLATVKHVLCFPHFSRGIMLNSNQWLKHHDKLYFIYFEAVRPFVFVVTIMKKILE